MPSRRSFFTRLAAFVAVVALAPEIAFKPRQTVTQEVALNLDQLISRVYAIARARRNPETIDVWCDRKTALQIQSAHDSYFRISSWHSPEYRKAMLTFPRESVKGIYEQLRECDA